MANWDNTICFLPLLQRVQSDLGVLEVPRNVEKQSITIENGWSKYKKVVWIRKDEKQFQSGIVLHNIYPIKCWQINCLPEDPLVPTILGLLLLPLVPESKKLRFKFKLMTNFFTYLLKCCFPTIEAKFIQLIFNRTFSLVNHLLSR